MDPSKAVAVMTSPDSAAALPVMRRFARLLLGSAADADRLVEEALGRVSAGDLRQNGADLRVAMLGRVVEAYEAGWGATCAARHDDDGDAGSGVTRSLKGAICALAPADRIPLLLVGVLGIAAEDVAVLLDTTERDVRRRVARARRLILPVGTDVHQGVLNDRAASDL
jgi:DNA-directed RNA polymerase specialized sigma24 family protein